MSLYRWAAPTARRLLAVLVTGLAACAQPAAAPAVAADTSAGPDAAADVQDPARYDKNGPWGVAMANFDAVDAARARTLHVVAWYPTQKPAAADISTLTAAYSDPVHAGQAPVLLDLFAQATPTCVRSQGPVSADAAAAAGQWPVVVFSHCSGCFASSSSYLAERLASHGFVVLAPDHPPNTMFDGAAQVGLSADMLNTRTADIRAVLDIASESPPDRLPALLRGHLDGTRMGIFGHSFGAITVGRVLQDDARPKVGVALAAPMDTPGLGDAAMAKIAQPVAFVLAAEDNSIGAPGNAMIRNNFKNAVGAALLIEVGDAGHFSFSDIAAIKPGWPGCGAGLRQTDGKPFTYLETAVARQVAARVITALMARHVAGDAAALQALDLPWPASVTVQTR